MVEREVKDEKFEYVIRTLSRTKRKDYENYVINAIWNRLNTRELKPVSQQYIKRGKRYYLIDLYFPQLNIGIECDEKYHKKKVEQDRFREMEIFDFLKQVKNTSDYQALHVDVSQSYEHIEAEINSHVQTILSAMEKEKENGSFKEWKIVSPEEYFEDKTEISIKDDIGFRTIVDTSNILFSTEYKGIQRSWFTPNTFHNKYDQEYKIWFPKLAIENKSVAAGWNNTLSEDGHYIFEYNEESEKIPYELNGDHYIPRVTFTQDKDPLTRINEYRFVGVFKLSEVKDNEMKYERIDGSFPLIK